MADFIEGIYRQNEWATLRLLDACRALTDEQLDARAVGAFGTVRETLQHFVTAEQRYVHHLGGAYDGPVVRDGDPWPGFDTLEAIARTAAPALIERARNATGTVTIGPADAPEVADVTVILAQALQHSTEHRSQVCTILTTLGIEPPGLSGWDWGEATGALVLPDRA
ncbi:MAG: DinB family protein [Dehalococcoidia bacterium]